MDYGRILANGIIAGGAALMASAVMINGDPIQVGIITAIIIGAIASAKEYLIENPPKNSVLIQTASTILDKSLLF